MTLEEVKVEIVGLIAENEAGVCNDEYETGVRSGLRQALDEIGKPPSYFINRGRCTVGKDKTE